jgi:hypothetical protein
LRPISISSCPSVRSMQCEYRFYVLNEICYLTQEEDNNFALVYVSSIPPIH